MNKKQFDQKMVLTQYFEHQVLNRFWFVSLHR